MAFVLKKATSYVWPVSFSMPIDGGKYEKMSFDAEFKRLTASRVDEILKGKDTTDTHFCEEILLGWSGIRSESGDDIPFSENAKAEILEVPGLATSIAKAYLESIAGSKIKN